MIAPERAQLSAALAQVVDGLVELVVARVVEELRPQLGELVAIRGTAPPAPRPPEPAPRPGAPTDLLTIAESAKLLNVARSTVSWWTYRTKTLPHISLGTGPRKLCRIRRADLEAFIADGPRGSAREQALELLEASEQRSEDRRRRRLERGTPRARKASTAATALTRVCAGCKEARPLSAFAARGVTVADRCDRCRRRAPGSGALKVVRQGEDPPAQPWGRRRAP